MPGTEGEGDGVAGVLVHHVMVEAVSRYGEERPWVLREMGERVGAQLAEVVGEERERKNGSGRPVSQLEIMKLVCRDVWPKCFGKALDSLRTNHKGKYMLHSGNFPWLQGFPVSQEPLERAVPWLELAKGIIVGSASALGLPCSATSSVEKSSSPSIYAGPSVSFTVTVSGPVDDS